MDNNRIKITPKWRRSKEQIWAERFEQLADKPKVVPLYRQKWFTYAAAAVVLVAVVLPVAAYIYKAKFTTQQEVATPAAIDTPSVDIAPAVPMFDFSDAPLEEVVSQIEAQYSIKVVRPTNMNYRYTGTFSGDRSAEDALEIVGEPFNIKFEIAD